MTKITFEEWKKNYKDIPFLEKNFPEMEDHGVDVQFIKETSEPNPTKTVRVFLYGGYYEIDYDGFYHLVLENRSWAEEKPDVIEKELYEWCDGEYFNYRENDPYGLESVTDNDYDENGNWRHE